MSRKRMVAPEFFTSQPVNNLTPTGMVTFIGLWVFGDDYGRSEDDPRLIWSRIWPRRTTQSERKVAADLDAIAGEGLICRYNVAGVAILHIPSWYEHQRVSHPAEPKLPPCPGHEPGLWEFFRSDSGGALEKFRSGSDNPPRSVVKSSSVEISEVVVQGDGPCDHGAVRSSCFVCKRHTTRSAAVS